MNGNDITRVNYYDRQFLRPADLADEQAYHRDLRRRHNIGQHRWGIVGGLELRKDGEGGLIVQPGFAIDGYGRELVVPQTRSISPTVFDQRGSETLEVSLVYDQHGSDEPPPGYGRCDGAPADAFYRWREQAQVQLDPADPDAVDRRRPAAVPEALWDYPPNRPAPDDQLGWPVYLGTIRRVAAATGPEPARYDIDLAGRPYVGLVGERVTAVSDRVRVEVGAAGDDPEPRFAVLVRDQPSSGWGDPRLEVDHDGLTTIRGAATVEGDLSLLDGGVSFGQAPAGTDQAHPWRIRRVASKATDPQNPAQQVDVEELRVEMDVQGGGRHRVTIGSWSAEANEFRPCLTVRDDCVVTVHGDLIVQGELTELQPRKPAEPGPEARRFATSMLTSGIGSPTMAILHGSASQAAQLVVAGQPPVLNAVDAARLVRSLVERFPPGSPEEAAFLATMRADQTQELLQARLDELNG